MELGWIITHLLPFLILITVLVFFHELGHFLSARRHGIKVEAFSIGMGPELFGVNDRHGTRWKFCLFPIGGYVKMLGDADAAGTPDQEGYDQLPPEAKDQTLQGKNVWQRMEVVAAGPIANYLLALMILAVLFMTVGQRVPLEDRLGHVIPESPAAQAGVKQGDKILSLEGVEFDTFQEMAKIIGLSAGNPLTLRVERDSKELSFKITPQVKTIKTTSGATIPYGTIGVLQGSESVRRGFFEAWGNAAKFCWNVTAKTFQFVGQMITGQRSTEGLSGPIGIAKVVGDSISGDWSQMFWIMAFLSINLGFINLLPIPMLDGGHLLFYIIEAIRGKPVSEKVQEYSFRVGFFLLIGLMLFTTFNDLSRIKSLGIVFSWLK